MTTRHVLAFDLETTGVSSFSDAPVSFGTIERVERSGTETEIIDSGLINPGRHIPAGASKIHGITDEMVAEALVLADAVEILAERISSSWQEGAIVVGMNVGYDLTMVDSLCRRLGLRSFENRCGVGPVMDILVIDRHFDRWRRGARKLGDLCRQYGVATGDAHSALDDARAALAVFDVLCAKYGDLNAISLADVNVTLREWYREWLRSFSAYRVRRGEPEIEPGRYEWPIHVDG